MRSKYLISLLWICLLCVADLAQTNYSESAEYKPRPMPAPKQKKKTDRKDSVVMMSAPRTTGDITVTIPVSVLDRSGAAVSGIKMEEVSVFVDGAEIPVSEFRQDTEPLTMVLVLDTSPSAQLRFETMQEQAAKLVGELPSNVKVMVIDFNIRLNVRSQPTLNRDETRTAISKVKMGEGTSIYSAIELLYEKLLPQVPGRKVLVLMTDGVDTTSEHSDFAKSLNEVEKEDVRIYPVYFDTYRDAVRRRNPSNDWIVQMLGRMDPASVRTSGNSEAEYKKGLIYLNDLAAASGGRVFSSEKLHAATNSLLSELANRYYVSVSLPRKNSGSRRVRVRINRPSLAVFARGSVVDK